MKKEILVAFTVIFAALVCITLISTSGSSHILQQTHNELITEMPVRILIRGLAIRRNSANSFELFPQEGSSNAQKFRINPITRAGKTHYMIVNYRDGEYSYSFLCLKKNANNANDFISSRSDRDCEALLKKFTKTSGPYKNSWMIVGKDTNIKVGVQKAQTSAKIIAHKDAFSVITINNF